MYNDRSTPTLQRGPVPVGWSEPRAGQLVPPKQQAARSRLSSQPRCSPALAPVAPDCRRSRLSGGLFMGTLQALVAVRTPFVRSLQSLQALVAVCTSRVERPQHSCFAVRSSAGRVVRVTRQVSLRSPSSMPRGRSALLQTSCHLRPALASCALRSTHEVCVRRLVQAQVGGLVAGIVAEIASCSCNTYFLWPLAPGTRFTPDADSLPRFAQF